MSTVPCHFFVQSNLNAVESARIQQACEGLERPCTLFRKRPFVESMPRLNASWPFVLLGSTTLNYAALRSRKYRRGVFFSREFTPEHYAHGYGQHYLNAGQKTFVLNQLPEDLYAADEPVFVRSNDDSKQVSGGVIPYGRLLEIKKNTEQHWVDGDLFSPQSQVCVNKCLELYAEYRLVVIDRLIAGSSRYQPSVHYSVPKDVLEFGRKMINTWQPHAIYVLDVCETDDGLKVVECNCVNGSGWYDANYASIIWDLARHQEQRS